MAFLPAEAADLSHGEALDPDLTKGVLHFVELERLDDGFNLLHPVLLSFPGLVRLYLSARERKEVRGIEIRPLLCRGAREGCGLTQFTCSILEPGRCIPSWTRGKPGPAMGVGIPTRSRCGCPATSQGEHATKPLTV